jgi:hypothetical protein
MVNTIQKIPERIRMKHHIVLFLVLICTILGLSFCTSSPFTSYPTPTWTPWPTDTPEPNIYKTLFARNTVVKSRAKEIAQSLSGEKTIDCGKGKGITMNEIPVNDCVVDAFQSKKLSFMNTSFQVKISRYIFC